MSRRRAVGRLPSIGLPSTLPNLDVNGRDTRVGAHRVYWTNNRTPPSLSNNTPFGPSPPSGETLMLVARRRRHWRLIRRLDLGDASATLLAWVGTASVWHAFYAEPCWDPSRS